MDFCVLELVFPTKYGHFMYAGSDARYQHLLKMFIIGNTPGMSQRVFKKNFKTLLHTHLLQFIEEKFLGLLLI